MNFIDVGYSNYVAADKIISILSPESLPVRRLVQDAKAADRVIDVTCGKKTKSVLVTESEHVIISSLDTEELQALFNK